MTQRLDKMTRTRFEAQIRILPQMGSKPEMEINAVARTKLRVYTTFYYQLHTKKIKKREERKLKKCVCFQ